MNQKNMTHYRQSGLGLALIILLFGFCYLLMSHLYTQQINPNITTEKIDTNAH